jgi:hypothetical protein
MDEVHRFLHSGKPFELSGNGFANFIYNDAAEEDKHHHHISPLQGEFLLQLFHLSHSQVT